MYSILSIQPGVLNIGAKVTAGLRDRLVSAKHKSIKHLNVISLLCISSRMYSCNILRSIVAGKPKAINHQFAQLHIYRPADYCSVMWWLRKIFETSQGLLGHIVRQLTFFQIG